MNSQVTRGMGRYVTLEERSNESGQCHPSQPPLSWAVVVGVNEYRDPRIADLKGAAQDAWNVYHALVSPKGGRVATKRAKLLLNERATKGAVEDALGHFLTQACPQDMITIYFAGHGAPEPQRPEEPFLLVHNSDLDSLASTAIAMSQLPQFLKWRNQDANKLLLVVDACHSGNIAFPGSRGFKVERGAESKRAQQITQGIQKVSKLHKGWGVLAATAPDQLATEGQGTAQPCILGGRPYEGGVFTCALLDGLGGEADSDQDRAVSYDELYVHLSQSLIHLRGAEQTPQRSGDLIGDIKLFSERSGPILIPPLPDRYKEPQVSWSAKPWAYGALGASLTSLGVALYQRETYHSLNDGLRSFLSDPSRSLSQRTELVYREEVSARDQARDLAISWGISAATLGLTSFALGLWELTNAPPADREVYSREPSLILNPMKSSSLKLYEPSPLKSRGDTTRQDDVP